MLHSESATFLALVFVLRLTSISFLLGAVFIKYNPLGAMAEMVSLH